jgi:hypothetical protein
MYYLCPQTIANKKIITYMRKMLLSLAALLIAGSVWAQSPNLISGQQVNVRLLNSVESKANIQTAPTAIIDANIVDANGNILVRRGTPVQLTIDTQHARGLGKSGCININCLSTTAVDGQQIFLLGGITAMGDDREGLAIGLGIGAGIVVFPFGLFCLCIKGEEAYIPSNTIITNVVVDDNYTIKY